VRPSHGRMPGGGGLRSKPPICHSKVVVIMDKEGRPWVSVTRPGTTRAEEMTFENLVNLREVIPEDKAIKIEACKQVNRLNRERRGRIAVERSPPFEIVCVESSLSPYADDFDPTRHFTMHYKLGGVEHRDTLSSLSLRIKASPESFPSNIVEVAKKAVREEYGRLLEKYRGERRGE